MKNNWPRIIAHADMDAFYASVEQLDDPALRGRPIIVGPNSHRGVVLTASYETRRFGVHSAMPVAEARRRCPGALFVPPRFERYVEVSRQIMQAFYDFSPCVEAISLDEAFLDLTGTDQLFGTPHQMALQIQAAVADATGGLTASVGIASTRYVAKVASDFNKPNGIMVVPPEDAVVWLDPLPVGRLWGAGPKTVPRLQQLGLYTIGDIRRADSDWLRNQLGSTGLHFQALSRAEDPRPVARRRSARSMGSDRTLLVDVGERCDIEPHLHRSAQRIARRLRNKGYQAYGVRVKLKTTDFRTQTRQTRLPEPSDSGARLFETAVALLEHFRLEQGFRLVGLAAYELIHRDEPRQLDLFAFQQRSRALESTLDELTRRFGDGIVTTAAELGRRSTVAGTTPNLDFIEDL